jgi:hypothetical protein
MGLVLGFKEGSVPQPDPTGLLVIGHLFQRSLHSAVLTTKLAER